ncbi:hypothetical protein EVAR_83903_1 [Eumeta japonica]|uniref:Uncharacterized protein n=1 Tax=Eumeta variegata TaxID=151549 RepID=A0A4C1UR98_EUMVA|nr:hypothetical protein EVAR_83903_1 [Eumeta japonica]
MIRPRASSRSESGAGSGSCSRVRPRRDSDWDCHQSLESKTGISRQLHDGHRKRVSEGCGQRACGADDAGAVDCLSHAAAVQRRRRVGQSGRHFSAPDGVCAWNSAGERRRCPFINKRRACARARAAVTCADDIHRRRGAAARVARALGGVGVARAPPRSAAPLPASSARSRVTARELAMTGCGTLTIVSVCLHPLKKLLRSIGPIATKTGSDDRIPGKLRETLKYYRNV